MFEWDEVKRVNNLVKHGVDFGAVWDFVWDDAIVTDRSRHADGERRFAAIGKLGRRLFTVIYTWRERNKRIISFRRANREEERIYEKSKRLR